MSVHSVVVRLMTVDAMSRGLAAAGTNAEVAATRIEASATKFEGAAVKMRSSMASTMVMAAKLGGVFGSIAIGGALVSATREVVTFQQTMLRTQNLAGATGAQIKDASTQLLNLSGVLATSPDQLATSLYHMYSVGLKGKDALDAVTVAAKGAKIGNADLEETTNALTATIASGLIPLQRGESAAHAYGRAMSQLNAIIGSGDMNAGQLNEALGSGLLSITKNFNQTLPQMGALLATLGDLNMRGAPAATGIRQIFQELTTSTPKADRQLARIGLSTAKLKKDINDPNKGISYAVAELGDAINRPGALGNDSIGSFLTGVYTKRSGSSLGTVLQQYIRESGKYRAILEANQGSSFDKQWALYQQTAGYQLSRLGNTIRSGLMKAVTAALPVISSAVQYLATDVPHAIARLWTSLEPAVKILGGAFLVALKLAAAAAVMLVKALGFLGDLLGHNQGVTTAFVTAIAGLWIISKVGPLFARATASAAGWATGTINSVLAVTRTERDATLRHAENALQDAEINAKAALSSVEAAKARVTAAMEVSRAVAGQGRAVRAVSISMIQAAKNDLAVANESAAGQVAAIREAQTARDVAAIQASGLSAKNQAIVAENIVAVTRESAAVLEAKAVEARARVGAAQAAMVEAIKLGEANALVARSELMAAEGAATEASAEVRAWAIRVEAAEAASAKIAAANMRSSGGGLLGKGGKGGGMAGMGLAMGATMVAGMIPDKAAGGWGGVASSALGGAGIGAMVGSFIPVIGTGIGAAVGGAAGALTGLISKFSDSGDAAKKAADDAKIYAGIVSGLTGTINTATGALTGKTRATLVDDLASSGELKTLEKAGISTQMFVDALMGNKGDLDYFQAYLSGNGVGSGPGLDTKTNQAVSTILQKYLPAVGDAKNAVLEKARADGLATAGGKVLATSIDTVSSATKLSADNVTAYAKLLGVTANEGGIFQQSQKQVAGAVAAVSAAFQRGDVATGTYLDALKSFEDGANTAATRGKLIGDTLVWANGPALAFAGAMAAAGTAVRTLGSDLQSAAAASNIGHGLKNAKDQVQAYMSALVNAKTGTINYMRSGAAQLISDIQSMQQAGASAASNVYQQELSQGISGQKAADDAMAVYRANTHDAFVQQLTDLGYTNAAAQRLADKYLGMPKNIKTVIEAVGENKMIIALDRIGALLQKAFDPKHPWVPLIKEPDYAPVHKAGVVVRQNWADVTTWMAAHPGYVAIDPSQAIAESHTPHAEWIKVANRIMLVKPKTEVLTGSAIADLGQVWGAVNALPTSKIITITTVHQSMTVANVPFAGPPGSTTTDYTVDIATTKPPPTLPSSQLPPVYKPPTPPSYSAGNDGTGGYGSYDPTAAAAASAASAAAEKVSNALDSIKSNDLPGLTSAIADASVSGLHSAFNSLISDLRKAGKGAMVPGLRAQESELIKDVEKRAKIESQINKVQEYRNNLLQAEHSLRDSIHSAITGSFNIASAGKPDVVWRDKPGSGNITIGSILKELRSKVKNASRFDKLLKKLRGEGLSLTLISQLAQAGPDALPEAEALAKATPKQLSQVNAAYSQLDSVGKDLGNYVASGIYKHRIDVANAMLNGYDPKNGPMRDAVNALGTKLFGSGKYVGAGFAAGLKSEASQVAAAAKSLGQTIVSSIKAALGIASPSKVAQALSSNFAMTLATGMTKHQTQVYNHARKLGGSAADGASDGLNDGGVSYSGNTGTGSGGFTQHNEIKIYEAHDGTDTAHKVVRHLAFRRG